jgi:O-methyltransferase involved in polyketide biosynthesis
MTSEPRESLSGVSETLLVTLYLRAMESARPDALIKDEKAVALVRQLGYDFARVRQIPLSEANKLAIILRNREFDREARVFLARNPEAVVVHIACGLDSRFERVDNGRVEWYDLDLPDVIALRRKFIGDEGKRYHLLGGSVFQEAWLEAVGAHRPRPFLFLAEGIFMYFEEAQVRSLLLALRDHFPGCEVVFDACSPLHVWVSNMQTSASKIPVRINWGIWHGRKIESWGHDIHRLDEWGFLDRPEPRLARLRWMRPIESLARTMRIYHFQLGKAAG